MKRFALLAMIFIVIVGMLTSCRPPELEGAFVDYNAKRFDSALKLAQTATEKYPTNAEAWYLLGELYGKKDQFSEMVNAFDKSLELSTQFADKIKAAKMYYFQTVFNKAVANYNAYTKVEDRSSDEAVKKLTTAIQNFRYSKMIKEDYKATSLIGLAYNLMGKRDSALIAYKQLTTIDPDTADGWISVGNIYFLNNDYDNAVANLNKALEIDPESIEAITLISQAYDLMNDREKAISAYEKAIAINQEEKAFPFNLGLLYIKMASGDSIADNLKTEYLEKSVVNFDKVLKMDTDMKEPYELKSTAEIQLGRYDDAVTTLKAAVDRFPDEGALWFNLGVAYSRLGQKNEAEDAFARAEELGYK